MYKIKDGKKLLHFIKTYGKTFRKNEIFTLSLHGFDYYVICQKDANGFVDLWFKVEFLSKVVCYTHTNKYDIGVLLRSFDIYNTRKNHWVRMYEDTSDIQKVYDFFVNGAHEAFRKTSTPQYIKFLCERMPGLYYDGSSFVLIANLPSKHTLPILDTKNTFLYPSIVVSRLIGDVMPSGSQYYLWSSQNDSLVVEPLNGFELSQMTLFLQPNFNKHNLSDYHNFSDYR